MPMYLLTALYPKASHGGVGFSIQGLKAVTKGRQGTFLYEDPGEEWPFLAGSQLVASLGYFEPAHIPPSVGLAIFQPPVTL